MDQCNGLGVITPRPYLLQAGSRRFWRWYGWATDGQMAKRKRLQLKKPCYTSGRGEVIRTLGLLVPNQARYQTAPRPVLLQRIL